MLHYKQVHLWIVFIDRQDFCFYVYIVLFFFLQTSKSVLMLFCSTGCLAVSDLLNVVSLNDAWGYYFRTCNREETFRRGWGCCTERWLLCLQTQADPPFVLWWNVAETFKEFIKLLTHFVYNSHGIKLFGLGVMALTIWDMNVWKV